MLAKNYNYPYEAILSKVDAKNNTKVKRHYPNFCRENLFYPVYNIEQIIEGINRIKLKIKQEIENGKVDKKEEVQQYILRRWTLLISNFFTEIALKIITDTGYKEEIKWVEEKDALFKLDIGNIIRVNGKKTYPIKIDEITINNISYEIGSLDNKALIFTFNFK